MASYLQPGFAIAHANHLESLAELLMTHMTTQPLLPLEPETIVVQSNGMADWLKLQQAQTVGVSAAMDFPMPASFLWDMYRRVLPAEKLDRQSPFDKASLQWRIFALLPQLVERQDFARPRRFLAHDAGMTRRFQLACKLADLFDQYQLYRPEWIRAWEAKQLINLGQDERWQATVWREIVASLPAHLRHHSRAHIHAAFLQALADDTPPAGLPRRVFLFGIHSMPRQLLDALHAMSAHCQLLMMVLSPCQEYWGEKGLPDLDAQFDASNPLLDAWGGQGRDFLQLLQDYQPNEAQQQRLLEVTPYEPARTYTRESSIMCALQQAILENRLPTTQPAPLPSHPGLEFLPAYSRQREVEILHDTLLDLFSHDEQLRYSDIVVMMPNIEHYIAHIEAVFNREPYGDARHLDYAINDRRSGDTPIYNAVDYLSSLPNARLTLSEVFSLLELDAVRRRFDICADDVSQLRQWAKDTHIRWGSDGEMKTLFDLPAHTQNTWAAGIDQLLAGFITGNTPLFSDTISVDEVSANQGPLLGQLKRLITALSSFQKRLKKAQCPSDWNDTFRDLLAQFFDAQDDSERLLIEQLHTALEHWQSDCERAEFDDKLPLTHARQSWLDALTLGGLSQRLRFNGVTFCTLMPMRALPFKHVFLLGMQDGEYPHETPKVDFDLMQIAPEKGDRNRRDDDFYLFLEALMSVRDSLHISWVGRNINDNTEHPACTLVEQLRDLINRCWHTGHTKACDALTQSLPLAAFSRHYFEDRNNAPHTWAREWRQLHEPTPLQQKNNANAIAQAPDTLSLYQLVDMLKHPEQVFYHDRLHTQVQKTEDSNDDEPFKLNNFEKWKLRNELLQCKINDQATPKTRWQDNGALPSDVFGQKTWNDSVKEANNIFDRFTEKTTNAKPTAPITIDILLTPNTRLTGRVDHVWHADDERTQLILTTPSNTKTQKGTAFGKLADCWVKHLCLNAQGITTQSVLLSLNKSTTFSPLDATVAIEQLQRLLEIYRAGWTVPLLLNANAHKLANPAPPYIDTPALAQRILTLISTQSTDADTLTQSLADLLYRPIDDTIARGDKTQ